MAGKKGRSGRPKGSVVTGETQTVTTRLTPKTHEKLKRAARGDGRTVSNYLMMLINDHLESLPGDRLAPN